MLPPYMACRQLLAPTGGTVGGCLVNLSSAMGVRAETGVESRS